MLHISNFENLRKIFKLLQKQRVTVRYSLYSGGAYFLENAGSIIKVKGFYYRMTYFIGLKLMLWMCMIFIFIKIVTLAVKMGYSFSKILIRPLKSMDSITEQCDHNSVTTKIMCIYAICSYFISLGLL